ncbi:MULTISPECIES: Rha family transcriptional regulator [Methylomonas]|uniref:Rha family transcriptional regulator n=2 Tax=Methylomonas TaxID=416 RepID=A0A140E4R9_9GAMM|nr:MULTISPECIES: Rha family transcriptional regulator [Methylomonas]AMK75393.1 hypothetical protein JT25_002630 [Methylomonas denitrificans]OAI01181.1 hypothetical protein A1342_19205 [Methylomonas methanica]TCV78088.1 regulatory protein Rha [Methylomonas methanica]
MSANARLKLVEVHGQKLTTTSLVIAELFGRPHKSVLRSLDSLKDRLKFVPISYGDSYGREQKMYQLDERAFLVAMPFIGGNKSVDGQIALVDEFMRLKKIINDPGRKAELIAKRNTGTEMADMLKFVRESAGKQTAAKHFISEHMFCNRALTGNWEAIDETRLDVYDARLLAEIRKHNMRLMTRHPKQANRKKLMEVFVAEYRAKHPRAALAA